VPKRDRAALTLTSVRQDLSVLPALEVIAVAASGETSTTPLGLDTLTVGSSLDADIVLADPRVSRKHCEIVISETGLIVRDLGSKNGIFVDDTRVLVAYLGAGSRVRIGDSELSLRAGGAPREVPLAVVPAFGRCLGRSVIMRALFAKLQVAARTNEAVLLLGESGTGKELLARGIHDASGRGDRPFVVFDCSAVAPSLVEAELFGAVRGAYTGSTTDRTGMLAHAEDGTLFLDEVGELPLDLQPKLLRVLESREIRPVGSNKVLPFRARVVAATHRDVRGRSTRGEFRPDLYYRLAVLEFRVPPLRERREDIELLVAHFLGELSGSGEARGLSAPVLDMLRAHDWPGNVRELRNAIARLAVFPDLVKEVLDGAGARGGDARIALPLGGLLDLPLREAREQVVAQFEEAYVGAKLAEARGNIARAGISMGVSRQFAHRLVERLGLRDAPEAHEAQKPKNESESRDESGKEKAR
jgi:DNA-binding NtrC family response regulator